MGNNKGQLILQDMVGMKVGLVLCLFVLHHKVQQTSALILHDKTLNANVIMVLYGLFPHFHRSQGFILYR